MHLLRGAGTAPEESTNDDEKKSDPREHCQAGTSTCKTLQSEIPHFSAANFGSSFVQHAIKRPCPAEVRR